jgi:hypothetical protein
MTIPGAGTNELRMFTSIVGPVGVSGVDDDDEPLNFSGES